MSLPNAFYDLPAEAFPLTMIAFAVRGEREVWRATVDGPGALFVPPLAKTFGEVFIRIEYGDGTVIDPREGT